MPSGRTLSQSCKYSYSSRTTQKPLPIFVKASRTSLPACTPSRRPSSSAANGKSRFINSAPQVLARNLAAIQPVIDAGEDAVCVIHGGVTSGLMMHWFGGTRYDYLLAPGEGYQVSFNEKKPVSYSKIM